LAHIPDGVLTTPVLVVGAAVSATLLAVALRRLDYPHLPQAAVLSAAFFGFGGVLVLGVNAMNLALPALACALLLRPRLLRPAGRQPFRIGIVAGALGVLLTAGLMALCLAASGEAFVPAARILLFAYVPLAVVEALITGTVVAFVQKVDPGLLRGSELQRE
jgi:cobalt/nickel transport system permease protein